MRHLVSIALLAAGACATVPAAPPVRADTVPPAAAVTPPPCADTVRLVVATTTDVHGRLRGWDYELGQADTLRGLSRAATVVDSLRAVHPDRGILLGGGDLLQGHTLRGLSRAATVVDSLRAVHPDRVILLDAGDLLQGNMLAYVAARVATDTINPIVAAMNAMRYDAAAIGNHEYNYGVAYLDRAVG